MADILISIYTLHYTPREPACKELPNAILPMSSDCSSVDFRLLVVSVCASNGEKGMRPIRFQSRSSDFADSFCTLKSCTLILTAHFIVLSCISSETIETNNENQ